MRLAFYLFYYVIGRTLFMVVFRLIFRTRVIGRDRVPREGGLLIICNHISFADPPLLATVMPRPVEFMTMAEMFRKPWMAWILKTVGCFPVDRSRVDRRAVREAIRRLQAGHCISIFPEGGIRLDERSVLGGNPACKPGAGPIALLGQAAVLPVIVRDTRKPYSGRNWLRRESMSVTFGYPFCLWNAEAIPAEEQKRGADDVLRTQLLKTVELT